MGLTILVIAGFQAWWLQNNFVREKKNLHTRAGFVFRNAVFDLQAGKLRWDRIRPDTGIRKLKADSMVMVLKTDKPGGGQMNIRIAGPQQQIVGMMNVMRDKIKDTTPQRRKGLVISSANTATLRHGDSLIQNRRVEVFRAEDNMIRLFYGIDSLQDSVSVKEVEDAAAKAFAKEKLDLSFTVQRKAAAASEEPVFGEPPPLPGDSIVHRTFGTKEPERPLQATVGFANPQTFTLQIDNTFSYVLKRMLLPLLFSLFLIGVTVLSFVLLYKNMRRQQRLTAIKNEFISNITHELKTPIATVGVAIEALKNFNALDSPERTKEYLGISSNELQRLSLLVDKVLKLSMFEKKEVELQTEPLNMRLLAEEVINSMKLQLEKQHAVLTTETAGDTGLDGDKLHLMSVVFNLLDNALKYSEANPEIHVEIIDTGKEVMLAVSDKGIGIREEYKDKLFDKFFRVPAGDTHNAKGYGLGLSYVSHVVKQHKGTIRVESEPGKGSRFIIHLPKTQHD